MIDLGIIIVAGAVLVFGAMIVAYVLQSGRARGIRKPPSDPLYNPYCSWPYCAERCYYGVEHCKRPRKKQDHFLVPFEPTEAMIDAGLMVDGSWRISRRALTVAREKMRLRYKAMIEAGKR